MRRRSFLRATVAGLLGLSTPGARAGARPPHVIVVGAGPAGLSAALHLVENGVFVTLLEAAGQVGGKAKGWTEPLDGVDVDVENGLHAVGTEQIHLRTLLERYALDDVLTPPSRRGLAARTPEGRVSAEDVESVTRARARRAGLPWGRLKRSARELARLSRAGLLARFSGQQGDALPLTPFQLWADAIARTRFWRTAADVDAATMAETIRTSGEVSWVRGNAQALIWEPLAEAFRGQRGKLRLNHRVQGLAVQDGRVMGVTVGEPLQSWEIPPPRGARWAPVPADEPLFVRRGRDGVEAIHGRCTHAGCSVALEDGAFACPCHGGRYDTEGRNIAGPPPRPLERARVEPIDRGAVRVSLGGTLETLEADAVVLAVDARSFGRILAPLLPDLEPLDTMRHVVGRFWFDRPAPTDAPVVEVVETARYVTATAWVHRLQDAAGEWARQHRGCVLEVRAAKALPPAMTNRAVLDLLETDVRLLFPSLLEANAIKRTLARGDDFTWFGPGWEQATLPVETGIPGLYAAGDHVRCRSGGQLVERALATGREAASAVLVAFGAPALPPL